LSGFAASSTEPETVGCPPAPAHAALTIPMRPKTRPTPTKTLFTPCSFCEDGYRCGSAVYKNRSTGKRSPDPRAREINHGGYPLSTGNLVTMGAVSRLTVRQIRTDRDKSPGIPA